MTKRVDEKWKEFQQTTFTKWVNNSLRGHLKTAKVQIENLQTDLQDGIVLMKLLETVASPHKPGRYNGNPTHKQQKIENIGTVLRFIQKEEIKLVNIGPEDIYDGNLKLILGLIWTLIQRYQIRSTGKALSTKNAMLAWINTQIPDQKVKNFTTDWNNGIALCALIDRIRPGLCPHYATLDPSNGLQNCTLAMKLAEEKLSIMKLMEPEDLRNPDVDELSVMTYLSYFCNPANERLMRWVQERIPDRKITNFKTDWNNGINLACLIDTLNPGTFQECRQLDPHNALQNLTRAMKMAEDHLGVKPVITPSQMADPSVDELNVVTYLSRYQYAKPVPHPHEVTCTGHGLYKAFVGRATNFEVDASRGGVGELKVTIAAVGGGPIQAEIVAKEHRGVFKVTYIPNVAGKVTIEVKWSGFAVQDSPFVVDVIDLGAFRFTGKQISGGQSTRVGKPVLMEAKGLTDISDLHVMVQHASGHSEVVRVTIKGKGEAECSYTPVRVGKDQVIVKLAGEELPGSPFEVKVVDPGQCSVSAKSPPAGKHILVNQKATFVVMASEDNFHGVVAEAKTPSGIQELSITPQKDGAHTGSLVPVEVGSYTIMVTCTGENIRGSPINLVVCDPSKCAFLDAFPRYLQLRQPVDVNISTKGAGPGELESHSSKSSVLATTLQKRENDLYTLKLNPNALGESTINLKWNSTTVPHTPFTIFVCDASKCSAYGPGLTSGKGKIRESFQFVVQVKQAGRGELVVKPKGPKTVYAAEIKRSPDDTYKVAFTTYETGPHSIEILWGGAQIPNSPYSVEFVKGVDASQFTATGEGLKRAIALEATRCMLVGPETGLFNSGSLVVEITGNQLDSKVVPRKSFQPKCGQLVLCVTDNGNGSYSVEYAVPKPGRFSLSVSCDGKPVPGSPFEIEVLPAADAGSCRVFGHAIDHPTSLVIGKALEFKVDSTTAGTGQITVTASSPSSKSLPVFLAEDKSAKSSRIHTVKIDPREQGSHLVDVLWSDVRIPGSPFTFVVCDPKKVLVLELPDSSSYTARVGEPFTFRVDTQKAGQGELKAAAKLENGTVHTFEQTPQEDRTICLSYTPEESGRMELLLTFSAVNLLPLPWMCEIANPALFCVTPPKGYGKQKENVKFVVSGLNKKNMKNLQITSVHRNHNATVKVEDGKDGTAEARFIAREVGEYTVEVKCARKHVDGSPFTVLVANPGRCRILGEIPSVVAIGQNKTFAVDTSEAGPGLLAFSTLVEASDAIDRLDCEFRVKATDAGSQQVVMKGVSSGKCDFNLTWAGFSIPNMPVRVTVADPKKCTFLCPQLKAGPVKTGESVVVLVDTSKGGACSPDVIATGPKANYTVALKDNGNGKHTANFAPWQDGDHTLEVLVGGTHVDGSPEKFEVMKPVDFKKITIGGLGLKQAIANRSSEVTIFARESKLFDRGVLAVNFEDGLEIKCNDNGNGTYNLMYIPKSAGELQLNILGEGEPIVGSPFNIEVKPEPDPQQCTVSGRAVEDPDTCQLVREAVELTVDSTKAGTGHLTVTGTQPNRAALRVFATEEKIAEKHLHYLKFDPKIIGTYTLSLSWSDNPIPGSPFQIQVVDPSKCHMEDPIPCSIVIGESQSFVVKTRGGGSGKLKVVPSGSKVKAVLEEAAFESTVVQLRGLELGESNLKVTFGGHDIPRIPFTVGVCDPSQCKIVNKDPQLVSQNVKVGSPFGFEVVTENAGKAELQVKPRDANHQCSINIRQSPDRRDIWEVSGTAQDIGEQALIVLWGGIEIPDGLVPFTACDPGKCIISGLPDPKNFIPITGEPFTFTIDFSKAGLCQEISAQAKLPEGLTEDLETQTQDAIATISCTPKQPGKLELILLFNGFNILSTPWVCNVPDPTRFRVTPPKGYAKQKDTVVFPITGVTEETQNFSISAVHSEEEATVLTESRKDDGMVIVRFSAMQIGEYRVEVKHAEQHIDGSPFTVLVANPDGCEIDGDTPKVVHVGSTETVTVDTSSAGPGELTCPAETIAGEINVTPEIAVGEDGRCSISFTSEVVGKYRLNAKWADHLLLCAPFDVSFVDVSKVSWSCAQLENGLMTQGEAMEILVSCKGAGLAVPQVKAVGPKSAYTVDTVDNRDGTFMVSLNPWQIGENSVEILWGGRPIADTPIRIEVVKAIEARTITASGDGLKYAIAGRPATVRINTPEVGLIDRGVLTATCASESATEEGDPHSPTLNLVDNEDGTYTLSLLPQAQGRLKLDISCEGSPITGSPFNILVHAATDASKCRAFGSALERKTGLVVNDPVQFSVDSTDAGFGHLTISATKPSGARFRVYTLEEEEEGTRKLHHLKFDPKTIGHYTCEVLWEGDHIPGSPFDFNILDPSRCKVNGLPRASGLAHIGEMVNFTVLFEKAGEGSPAVTVTLPGEEEVIALDPTPISVTESSYDYQPSVLGHTSIIVRFAGYDVPGSPFKLQVIDPTQFGIVGLNLKGKYALVCELVSFGIQGKSPWDEKLAVVAHGPSADLTVDVKEKGDGSFVASFVPIEPGCYEVFVECAGAHVTGSPFTVYVADPSKCQLLGELPTTLQVGVKDELVVKTRGAGVGDLNALLNGLKEDPCLDCSIENQGLDTYAVTLTGKKVGEASVEIQWAGFCIPQSPFKLSICDASKCKAFGQALVSKKGKAGEAITFTVVTFHAGKGKLNVSPTGPSAQYNVDIKETKPSTYEVTFTPWEVGEHKVEVLWGSAHIPKSPFPISIENPMETNVCNATGSGLKHAIATKPAKFSIISSEIGLLEKNALKVSVIGVQSAAEVVIKDNNNGSYTVQYVAPTPGAYVASVAFYDRQIPGSPYKINVVPGPDATKCRAYGPALHPNSLHIAGSPLEFYVDTSEGGYGHLRVYVQGPHDYHPRIFMADDGKGVHSIKFDAMKAGKYFAVVAWSDQHIPGSPFKLKVHPAANAAMVKAYGPGLENGFLGDTGEFTVETKNAGIGTILIRVHGIRDAFKIEAAPKSESDQRTLLAQYHPRIPGEYVIFVRWSGVHVPGSPFTVKIKRKPGEELLIEPPGGDEMGVIEPDSVDILESTFAQQAPSYESSEKSSRKGKRASDKKKASKKGSDKEKKHRRSGSQKESGDEDLPHSPSGGVGPVALSMKMKANPSFQGLAQPYPPGGAQSVQQRSPTKTKTSPKATAVPQQGVVQSARLRSSTKTKVSPKAAAVPVGLQQAPLLMRTPSGDYVPIPASYLKGVVPRRTPSSEKSPEKRGVRQSQHSSRSGQELQTKGSREGEDSKKKRRSKEH